MNILRIITQTKKYLPRLAVALLCCALLASCSRAPEPPRVPKALPGLQPIEEQLKFTLLEQSGEFLLELHTKTIYPCSNYRLLADLQQVNGILTVSVKGSQPDPECQTRPGPAQGVVNLGPLEGERQLIIANGGQEDVYSLAVSAEQVQVTPSHGARSQVLFPVLQRLPPDTFWVVVFRPMTDADGDPITIDLSEYQSAAALFFETLETLGVQPYIPTNKPYTNVHFLPIHAIPGRVNDPAVGVPVSGEEQTRPYSMLNWTEVRYYTHDDPAALQPQIEQALRASQPDAKLLQAALFLPDGRAHSLNVP